MQTQNITVTLALTTNEIAALTLEADCLGSTLAEVIAIHLTETVERLYAEECMPAVQAPAIITARPRLTLIK